MVGRNKRVRDLNKRFTLWRASNKVVMGSPHVDGKPHILKFGAERRELMPGIRKKLTEKKTVSGGVKELFVDKGISNRKYGQIGLAGSNEKSVAVEAINRRKRIILKFVNKERISEKEKRSLLRQLYKVEEFLNVPDSLRYSKRFGQKT